MEANIKIININEVSVGMILAKSILKDGKVIVYRNSPLKEKDIITLKRENITENLFVYDNISYSKEKHTELSQKKITPLASYLKNINTLENTYNNLLSTLGNIFYKIKLFQNTDNNELREFSNNLLAQSKNKGAVIHNLVLNGSSNSPIYRHSINVALLSNLLGQWINLKQDTLNLLTYSALLHDIGKLKIDDRIINKKTTLTTDEENILNRHPVLGYEIVKNISFLNKSVAQGVLLHHENIDGTGYPFNLMDEKLTTFSKIISITDFFDNHNSNRGIHKKHGPFETLELMKEASFNKLDYKYTNIFITNILNFFIGKNVTLNNGEKAQIMLMNVNNIDCPVVNINNTFIDLYKHSNLKIVNFNFDD